MKPIGVLQAAACVVALAALAACGEKAPPEAPAASTAVLGGFGNAARPAASAPLMDAQGRVIPRPTQARNAQVVLAGPDTAVAVWEQDDRVVASSYTPAAGWTPSVPLEEIYGEAGKPQLAGNGQGAALAVWQHTVGSIQSLRFSRLEGSAWTVPDVMPGALPRPPSRLGREAPLQLHMDAQGNAFAQWPSGFAENEVQTARFVAGQGWTRALSEPVTATAPQAAGARANVQ